MGRVTKAPANRKTGNLWFSESDQRWHFDVSLKRRDGTVYRKHGSRKLEKDARKARDDAFAEFNKSEGANARGWTVQTWCEHCIAEVWPNELAGTTVDNYRHWLTTRIFPKYGAIRIDDLTTPQLQTLFNAMRDKDGIHVAIRTQTALSSALTRAVQSGLTEFNACRSVRLRAAKATIEDDDIEQSKRLLTDEEALALIEAARGTPVFLSTLLGIKCGLRFGEANGLEWDRHVDLDGGVIRIRQQVQNIRGKGLQVVAPKSSAGKRDIPIPASVKAILREERERARQDSLPFVCHKNGRRFSSQNGSVMFREVAIKAGLDGKDGKPIPTHHCCRTYCLTYLANRANNGLGLKPHVLLRIAGHSKIDTTLKYYLKTSDEDLRAAMACIP